MSVSATLTRYLDRKSPGYDLIEHGYTTSAVASAYASHLPLREVAKAVVLHDQDHYVMAVVPAMNRLVVSEVEQLLGRRLVLAKESELGPLFRDCEPGAIPALGQPFGLELVWDDSLAGDRDVYIEAGDHRHLVHLGHDQFMALMRNRPHGPISCAPEEVWDLNRL